MSSGKAVFLALLTGVAASAGTFFALHAATGGQRGVMAEVPPLAGLTPEQARQLLEAKDLRLVVFDRRPDGKQPVDKIVKQVPDAKSRVARQSAIYVILSLGRRRPAAASAVPARPAVAAVPAPTAVRPAPAAARPAASAVPAVPAPAAARPAPAAARPAAAAQVVVPRLYYKRPARARRLLEAAGLKVGRRHTISDEDKASGIILRQRPAAGAKIPPGAAVDYWVNDTD